MRLSDETLSNLKRLPEGQTSELLSDEPVRHRNKNRTPDAHEAIHPTCFDEDHEPDRVSFLPEKLLYSRLEFALASQAKRFRV